MNHDEFAASIEQIRLRLYRTALLYMGSESAAMDVLDETVYKALKNIRKLREPKYFNTWITRILINECHNENKYRKRFQPIDELPEPVAEEYDSLPLKEAIQKLPPDLKEVIILRYFAGYTLAETAEALQIPQGTAATRQRRALQLLRLELEEEVSE